MRVPMARRFFPRCLRIALLAVLIAASGGAAVARAEGVAVAVVLENARVLLGPSAATASSRWLSLLEKMRSAPELEQLRAVNNFWNSHLKPADDMAVWGVDDYWATPLESLGKGAGDCEDYVIGKYFSLVFMGMPPEKLRFIYVKARLGTESIAHMVLGYYATPGSEPLVLDSLESRIVSASRRHDLTPVFSFNIRGIYVPGARPASVDRIGRWKSLLARMRSEGFQP
ncbi:transglutaminase-like cysteine peptidase [Eoetvoesiella sp.]|uniref:transglutaminase-like cysteine peptidase n=1 Tax=Eoetvoesiella sp. TaxID=1966355 RepID=UPI002D7E6936|nr:transglutaminase-like cysteine peptidase [Eoetvoesiella sp.]